VQYHGEKTKHHTKSSSKNMQSKGQPFNSPVLCLVQWATNTRVKFSTL